MAKITFGLFFLSFLQTNQKTEQEKTKRETTTTTETGQEPLEVSAEDSKDFGIG